MTKKARFYSVIYKTAYEDNVKFYKPVPAPSKVVAASMIRNENCNVTDVVFLGWKEIWLATGDFADSRDLAIFGITINNHDFTYTSQDVGWDYLNVQFYAQITDFIDKNHDYY
ncbi:hypothetical protein LAX15_23390 [Escherichia coli]|nr:hypothetical protein [Escherichia coli]